MGSGGNHVVEERTDHEEIGLQGFDLNLFDKDKKGVGREGSIEFPYLLMVIKLWPGNCKTKFKLMNHKVHEENGGVLRKFNVRYRKVRRFSRNEFGRTLVVSSQIQHLVLGGRGCGRRKRI